jgi:ribosomal protein S6E (S10)
MLERVSETVGEVRDVVVETMRGLVGGDREELLRDGRRCSTPHRRGRRSASSARGSVCSTSTTVPTGAS